MTASIIITRKWILIAAATLLVCTSLAQAQSSSGARTRLMSAKAQTPARDNSNFDQIVKLGDEARSAGRLDDAVDLYTKAVRIRPEWPDGWWYLGAILYEKDLYPQARDAFNKLVALDPTKGPSWGMLGLCEFQTHDYERAVISLQRGRTLGLAGNQELESVIRYHTALLYIHFEQFEIGYEILKEFVRVGNDSPKVVEAFGLTILRMPLLPNEIPADKHEQVLLAGQAGLDMAARRLDESRKVFDTLLSRYPNEPNIHYSFGVLLINQDADAALKEFRRTLEISPSHQPAIVQMAFEYLKREEYNEALPLAEKAVQLGPKMFAARNVLGRVLLELGQVERAIKELEEGVRLAPTSPEMHFALARAYTRAGRKEDAARERETFKRLQDQYEQQRRDALKTGTGPDKTQDKP